MQALKTTWMDYLRRRERLAERDTSSKAVKQGGTTNDVKTGRVLVKVKLRSKLKRRMNVIMETRWCSSRLRAMTWTRQRIEKT